MRLIDADALEPDTEYDDGEYWAYSRTQIENALTIEERKKGKWLDEYRYGYKCSECGGYLEIECEDIEMNFCPNCGADMREGEQE